LCGVATPGAERRDEMPTRQEMRSLGNEIVRSYEGRITSIAQLKPNVSATLKGFDRAHAAMTKEVKADLAKVAPALQKAETQRHQMESQRIAQRKSDVSAMLMGFHREQAGAHDEWKKLGATMHARRTGKAPKAAPPPQGEG